MSSRIELQGVGQVFAVRSEEDRKRHDFVALDGVDLTVEAGEFLTLVGPSGCGKSTILDLVAGLSTPTSGTVSVDGHRVTGPGPDRSVVFQQYTLLPWRTALGNIEFALEATTELKRSERADRAQAHRHHGRLHHPRHRRGGLPRSAGGGHEQPARVDPHGRRRPPRPPHRRRHRRPRHPALRRLPPRDLDAAA